MREPTIWILARSVTGQAVQLLGMARGLKFGILDEEMLCCQGGEHGGADQLHGYRTLICIFVFTFANVWFYHDAAELIPQSFHFAFRKCLTIMSNALPLVRLPTTSNTEYEICTC